MRFSLPISSRLVPILFAPAGLMLIVEAIRPASTLEQRLLAIALTLFCPELARMAGVDLKNIQEISAAQPCSLACLLEEDSRLALFYRVVVSTVVLELLGFYTALFSLPFGGAIVIMSQLWFNLLAGVQLEPSQVPSIVNFDAFDRVPVLLANSVGLSFLFLWPIQSIRVISASSLLILIVLFLVIKYSLPVIGPKVQASKEAGTKADN